VTEFRPSRLYAAVALAAVVVHVGALWNRFVFDDLYIVVLNPVLHAPSGVWRVFGESYWAGNLAGAMYRPLAVATYALDWMVDGAPWFHAVNLLWHAGASVAVAALALRLIGHRAALVAGLLFAVHPVHVEAVANVVGRNELMAALFTLLAVYAAVERRSVGWTAAALVGGLLSKENAAVAPALIGWAWLVGLRPLPERRRLAAFVASWMLIGAAYGVVRWAVLHPYVGSQNIAPQLLGQSPVAVRLTAVAAFTDVARLLVFPLHLQGDYSPDERTAVLSPLDSRFLVGFVVFLGWLALLVAAWRRRRVPEAYGLGWVGIAYLPVANLLFPHGVVVAERLLYLPSAGLVLAAAAALARLEPRRLAVVATALVLAGGVRSALRVPVWRSNRTAALSLVADAPRSYRTWDYAAWELLWSGQSDRALAAFRRAGDVYGGDARVYLAAAHMAFVLGRVALADSLLARADSACPQCPMAYRNQAGAARLRGDTAAAIFLLEHQRRRK
jgi:protein O-mannosyl-transferase